jgi:hypothetical protein
MPASNPLNEPTEVIAECWCPAPDRLNLCAGCEHPFAAHYQSYGEDDGCSAREAAGDQWGDCKCRGFTRRWRRS